MMLYTARCRRAGFTLIEIMIVIAIIAILAGIVVPNFREARAEAYLQSCVKNTNNLGIALSSYLTRHSEVELYALKYGNRPGDPNYSAYAKYFYQGNGITWGGQTKHLVFDPLLVDGGYIEEVPKCPIGKYMYYLSYNKYPLHVGEESCKGWMISCQAPTSKPSAPLPSHVINGIHYHPAYIIGSGSFMGSAE